MAVSDEELAALQQEAAELRDSIASKEAARVQSDQDVAKEMQATQLRREIEALKQVDESLPSPEAEVSTEDVIKKMEAAGVGSTDVNMIEATTFDSVEEQAEAVGHHTPIPPSPSPRVEGSTTGEDEN